MRRRLFRDAAGYTILELIVVALITGIIMAFAISMPTNRGAGAAKANLAMIWNAERRYFIYTNGYTTDWTQLQTVDPSPQDIYFDYTLTSGGGFFQATATRKAGGNVGTGFYVVDSSSGPVSF